jgi:uncharacterized membrane protein
VHVIAVLFWIGGVGFVTRVLMPTLRTTELPQDRLRRFQQMEARFAWQARLWVLLAGASGLWLVARADLWSRFLDARFWWMHLMVALDRVCADVVRDRAVASSSPPRQYTVTRGGFRSNDTAASVITCCQRHNNFRRGRRQPRTVLTGGVWGEELSNDIQHQSALIILSVGMVVMFGILLLLGQQIYQQAPPIPEAVKSASGETLFTRSDIEAGQNIWQSIGGMQQGSIWGHGSYLAPDWSADWLHREAEALLALSTSPVPEGYPRRKRRRCEGRAAGGNAQEHL